jgi:Flp pilus assembly protein TadG
MKMLLKYIRDEKGATAVEFGMVAILFVGFLFGVIELSRVYWTMNTLQYAIEDTARYALVNEDATDSDLQDYAAEKMAGINVDTEDLTVTTSQTTISGITFIEVNGSYNFTTLVPAISDEDDDGFADVTLTAQARMPYSR